MITKNIRIRKGEKDRSIIFPTLIVVLTLGLIAFLVFANIKIGQRRQEMMSQVESLNKEIKALEEQKNKLEAGIGQSQSDIYWEAKMREQGYEKPGEETVVVLPPEENKEAQNQEKGFFEKILEKLGF